VRALKVFYEAEELLGMDEMENLQAWMKRAEERPAVQKGLQIPSRG
jgi:GSH-dependent disulfide-bond oxidoreductase